MKRTEIEPIRVPELDGIRGLAILLVVIWHYAAAGLQTTNDPIGRMLQLSWSGVDLFFVLSGFLIGGILLDQRTSKRYFRTFYTRRCLRIMPLYYAWLGLFFLVPVVLAKSAPLQPLFGSPQPIGAYATFTQNLTMSSRSAFGADWLAITWSLAVEEQFYLVLPLLIWLVPQRRLPMVLIAFGAAAPLLRIATGMTFASRVLLPCRADSLLFGVLIAWAIRDARWRRILVRMRPVLYVVAATIFGMLGLLCAANSPWLAGSPWLYSVLAAFYATLLSLVVTGTGYINRFFRQHCLRAIGLLAYGIYLFHQTVSHLAHNLILGHSPNIDTPSAIGVTVLAGLLTYALASVSWRVFEKPLVAIGHRASYDRPLPPPSTPVVPEVLIGKPPSVELAVGGVVQLQKLGIVDEPEPVR